MANGDGGTVVDVLGHPVNVGDTIAGAFRIGNVAVMRVGTVQSFSERANKLTIRVHWTHDSNNRRQRFDSDIVGNIEADLFRFVVVQSNLAPSERNGLGTPSVAVTPVIAAPDESETDAEISVANP